jgi:hypothetical protein
MVKLSQAVSNPMVNVPAANKISVVRFAADEVCIFYCFIQSSDETGLRMLPKGN